MCAPTPDRLTTICVRSEADPDLAVGQSPVIRRPARREEAMTRRWIRGFATAASALALTFAAAIPATAESTKVRDRGDFNGQLDIWTVKLNYARDSIVTTVKVRDFQRRRQQEIFVLYDVRRGGQDFEYAAVVRMRNPVQLLLYKVGSDGTPEQTIRCRDRAVVDYARDRLRYTVPRACLRRPGQARINIMSARQPVDPILDYAPAEGRFTRWVERG
jgi:hypothetical protein